MFAKLTKEQFGYIEHLLPEKIDSQYNSFQKKYIYITINEETANSIREYAENKLLEIGFDENGEPNEEGKVLEELLDIFYIK